MFKNRLFILITLFSVANFAQNNSYLDSIETSFSSLTEQEKIYQTLKIPHDKFMGNIEKSELLIRDAIEASIEIRDTNSLANLYLKLSITSAFKDNSKEKVSNILKAIHLFELTDNREDVGMAYGELGFQMKYDNLNKALNYMRIGMKLIEKSNSRKKIDHTYDNYGTLQSMLKNYDSAIYYHKKSLRLKKHKKDSIGIPYGYAHLASVNLQIGEYNVAKKYIDSSYTIRKRNDIYGIADVYAYYGDLYFVEKKYTKAIDNFLKGYTLSKENNFQSLQKYCAEYLTKSYLGINDYKNAYRYNSIFQSLKDSILNIQTNNRVAELQIEFETEKKEKEIAIQKEEIKSKNLYGILLGSGLLLLSIISLGTYKYQRTKRKQLKLQLDLKDQLALTKTTNKLQEQRLHISRDLHDNIGSQLTFIISSIDNLKFLTKSSDEKLKNKLSDINNFASSTISQLRDTIWAMNKNEISYEDFYGRLVTFIEKAKLVKEDIKFDFSNSITSSPKFSSVEGINIFRVIQESINNAIKYANASKINILLSENQEQIEINIEDDGIGFDINEIEIGNGLNNMQYRMGEINGTVSVNSKPTIGTKIGLLIPKNT